MIKLQRDNCQLDIDIEQGGRIAQLSVDSLKLLVDKEDNPIAWGSYPMVPWVGRLQHGIFNYQGSSHTFPLNMPPHAIHGTCFDREWKLISQSETQVEIHISLGDNWPFSGYAKQCIRLEENSLSLELSVHSEKESFPASIGWHPWFKRNLECGLPAQLAFLANKKFECDSQQIPTGKFLEQGEGPWDDCFIELAHNPSITWGEALRLEIESSCDHWVVYNMPEHALCVEPQTAAANALNNTNTHIVTPDSPLCATTTLSWQLL